MREVIEEKTYALPSQDTVMSRRFDIFVRRAFLGMIPLHLAVIILNAAFDMKWQYATLHSIMAAVAYLIAYRSKDAVKTIIFTHVYATFSITTYLFALLNNQTASYGLVDAERSALVAAASQVGLLAAFLLIPDRPMLPSRNETAYAEKRLNLNAAQYLLMAVGFAALLLKSLGILSDVYASTLISVLYVAIAVRLTFRAGNVFLDPIFILSLGALAVASVFSNERTGLMAAILLLAFLVPMTQSKVLTLKNIAVGYVGWRLLAAFSAVAISARWSREFGGSSIAALFIDGFFSFETMLTLLNPFHVHAAEGAYAGTVNAASGYYSDFYPSVMGGNLLARLTVLPQMDIVVGRLGEIVEYDFAQLQKILLSVLPSVGQEKSLIFSDEIVWALGLRDPDSIGRPLVTIEGELYALGGYLTVFFYVPLIYSLMYWFYTKLCMITGSRAVGILIMSQIFVHTMFSTTILSVTAISSRGMIQLALILLAAVAVGGVLRQRERASVARKARAKARLTHRRAMLSAAVPLRDTPAP